MQKLFGVVTPIITPLTEEDQIDVESLKRLVDHCITCGIQALYPGGTTGEMMYLTVAERKLVAETVVAHTNRRIPVYIHVGAWNLADTIELARHAYAIGADGIGVVTPTYFRISDQGLLDFYTAVSRSVPDTFPIYLYGIPQNAVNDISPALARVIAEQCPNVVGIKYSYADMTRLQQMIAIPGFSVLVGPDHLFQPVCAMGGDGTVSGNSQCIPEHYEKVWEAIQAGDFAMAAKYQLRTNALNEILCAVNNIAAYKVVLKAEGIISTTKMRRPMENLTPQQEQELLESLRRNNYRSVIV